MFYFLGSRSSSSYDGKVLFNNCVMISGKELYGLYLNLNNCISNTTPATKSVNRNFPDVGVCVGRLNVLFTPFYTVFFYRQFRSALTIFRLSKFIVRGILRTF